MKHGAMIKGMCAGLFMLCVLAVCAGSAGAVDWQLVEIGSKDVAVYVMKDPKVVGGMRDVQMKFVNNNDYDLAVTYKVVIRCLGVSPRDADTGKSRIEKHGEDVRNFSYVVCPDDDPDDVRMIEIRLTDVKKI